jgi:hypothetical protein
MEATSAGKNDKGYLFKWLLLANFLQYMEAGEVPALLMQIADSFQMGSGMQGILGGVVFLSISLGGPIAGYFFRIFPHKTVLVTALSCNIIFTFLWALTPVGLLYSTNLFIAIRFMMGLCQCIVCVFLPLWTNENAPKEKRTSWMSYLQVCMLAHTHDEFRYFLCLTRFILFVQASVPFGVMTGYVIASVLVNYTADQNTCWGLLCFRWPLLLGPALLTPLYVCLYFVPSEDVTVCAAPADSLSPVPAPAPVSAPVSASISAPVSALGSTEGKSKNSSTCLVALTTATDSNNSSCIIISSSNNKLPTPRRSKLQPHSQQQQQQQEPDLLGTEEVHPFSNDDLLAAAEPGPANASKRTDAAGAPLPSSSSSSSSAKQLQHEQHQSERAQRHSLRKTAMSASLFDAMSAPMAFQKSSDNIASLFIQPQQSPLPLSMGTGRGVGISGASHAMSPRARNSIGRAGAENSGVSCDPEVSTTPRDGVHSNILASASLGTGGKRTSTQEEEPGSDARGEFASASGSSSALLTSPAAGHNDSGYSILSDTGQAHPSNKSNHSNGSNNSNNSNNSSASSISVSHGAVQHNTSAQAHKRTEKADGVDSSDTVGNSLLDNASTTGNFNVSGQKVFETNQENAQRSRHAASTGTLLSGTNRHWESGVTSKQQQQQQPPPSSFSSSSSHHHRLKRRMSLQEWIFGGLQSFPYSSSSGSRASTGGIAAQDSAARGGRGGGSGSDDEMAALLEEGHVPQGSSGSHIHSHSQHHLPSGGGGGSRRRSPRPPQALRLEHPLPPAHVHFRPNSSSSTDFAVNGPPSSSSTASYGSIHTQWSPHASATSTSTTSAAAGAAASTGGDVAAGGFGGTNGTAGSASFRRSRKSMDDAFPSATSATVTANATASPRLDRVQRHGSNNNNSSSSSRKSSGNSRGGGAGGGGGGSRSSASSPYMNTRRSTGSDTTAGGFVPIIPAAGAQRAGAGERPPSSSFPSSSVPGKAAPTAAKETMEYESFRDLQRKRYDVCL